MTIDEAIIHAEEVMVDNLEKTKNRNSADPVAIQCFECADEHRQLAEWLKELKQKRQAIEDIKAEIELIKKAEYQIYGKGSWNFVGKCLDVIDKHTIGANGGDK